jgi:hypothetical protein
MLHTETVETRTLDLIRTLMSDTKFQDFFLVGGTALSLKLGHRMSIDIDMFTDRHLIRHQYLNTWNRTLNLQMAMWSITLYSAL